MTEPPLELGKGVSAWWLRVAVAVTGSAVLVIPLVEGTAGGLGVIVGLAVLASVYAPASPAPALVVLGGAVLLALAGDDPLRPAVLAMIPTAHVFHVCCGIAGVLPVRGRLHLAALRRPALRLLAVQGVAFVMAGLAALLPTGRVTAFVEASALVGLVAMALIVLAAHRARSDHAHTGGGGRSPR
jgi:hypothetical protein